MSEKIDIKDKCKASILAALYNNARPQGFGYLAATPEDMSKENAAKLLESQAYFDYLGGRVMKIDLKGDELDTWLYDRDNGEGAAKSALTHAGIIS